MNKTVQFKDLKIGDSFGCWGDTHINYNYPKWCECVKTNEDTAQEIDGISFLIHRGDDVMINQTALKNFKY